MFEHTVDDWKKQKRNTKGVDKTYGERECICLFIKDYEAKYGKLEEDHLVEVKFDFNIVHGWLFYFNEASFECAVKAVDITSSIDGDQFVYEALRCGVLSGKVHRKRLQDDQYRDISRSLAYHYPGFTFSRVARFSSAIALKNSNNKIQRFSKEDTYIIGGTSQYAGELWYVKINCFILVSIQGNYFVFVDGEYFVPVFHNNVPVIHPWTGTYILDKVHFARERLMFSSQIIRKVVLYPIDATATGITRYIPVDFECSPSSVLVKIPYYPKIGDDIAICGPSHTTWYGRVLERTLQIELLR